MVLQPCDGTSAPLTQSGRARQRRVPDACADAGGMGGRAAVQRGAGHRGRGPWAARPRSTRWSAWTTAAPTTPRSRPARPAPSSCGTRSTSARARRCRPGSSTPCATRPWAACVTFDADGQHQVDEARAMVAARAGRRGRRRLRLAVPRRTLAARTAEARRAQGAPCVHSNLTSGLRLTDAHNGLRAMSRTVCERIDITQNRMAHAIRAGRPGRRARAAGGRAPRAHPLHRLLPVQGPVAAELGEHPRGALLQVASTSPPAWCAGLPQPSWSPTRPHGQHQRRQQTPLDTENRPSASAAA